MPTHIVENVVAHMSLMAENNQQVKEEIINLRDEFGKKVKENKQKIEVCLCPFEFTMTDFERLKQDHDSWFSPSFYTHAGGYRICLKVSMDTLGNSKHVSVYCEYSKVELFMSRESYVARWLLCLLCKATVYLGML